MVETIDASDFPNNQETGSVRRSRTDTGQKNEYGERPCPRCGKMVSRCAFGFQSHLKACLRRDVVVNGKVFKHED